MTEAIERPSVEVMTMPEQAKALTITDQFSYDFVVEFGKDASRKEKIILDFYKPRKAAARAVWQQWLDDEKMLLDPISETKRICASKIGTWDAEQARLRAEAQRKADEEAHRMEEEARLALALQAEEEGASEEITEEILSAPTRFIRPVVAPTFQKAAGVSGRSNWKAEIVDMKALCRAIADGKVPTNYVEGTPALNSRVRADKENSNIPGVRAVEDRITSFRR
jgi:hypothetical protein